MSDEEVESARELTKPEVLRGPALPARGFRYRFWFALGVALAVVGIEMSMAERDLPGPVATGVVLVLLLGALVALVGFIATR